MSTALGGALLACSSSPDSPAAPPTDGGSGDATVLVGGFNVELIAPTTIQAAYTKVVGAVHDGPTPSMIIWESAAEEGRCRLLTPRVPFCSVSCGSAVCVDDEQCQPNPAAVSVGTVTVNGLLTTSGATQFAMDPVANNYQPTVSLPYPAFQEGDSIRFAAAGAQAGPFLLEARGISPLELGFEAVAFDATRPLDISWTPAKTAGISRIFVKLDVAHHGGAKGKIECDAEDTGSLQISAAMLTQLLDLGVAGFPTIVVGRKSVGSAVIASGRVDLTLLSQLETAVEIPGLTSCNEDTDCSAGTTCQADLTCR